MLGGTSQSEASRQRVLRELQQLRAQAGGLAVLFDSDVAGRQARTWLEAQLPGCLHAFVPAPLAAAAADTA